MGWNHEGVAHTFIAHLLGGLPEGHLRVVRDWMFALLDGPTYELLLIAHILLDFQDVESWSDILERSLTSIDAQLKAISADPFFESPPEGAKEDRPC